MPARNTAKPLLGEDAARHILKQHLLISSAQSVGMCPFSNGLRHLASTRPLATIALRQLCRSEQELTEVHEAMITPRRVDRLTSLPALWFWCGKQQVPRQAAKPACVFAPEAIDQRQCAFPGRGMWGWRPTRTRLIAVDLGLAGLLQAQRLDPPSRLQADPSW